MTYPPKDKLEEAFDEVGDILNKIGKLHESCFKLKKRKNKRRIRVRLEQSSRGNINDIRI